MSVDTTDLPDAVLAQAEGRDLHGDAGGWLPIATAPDLERVMVGGWQPRKGSCAGYWWWHEDVIADGVAMENPSATLWCRICLPAFPPPPAATR